MLGYILYGMFFILLICYCIDGYDYEKCHLRSISGLICTQRECGCFAMGLGNLILFEMVEHTHPVIAWIMWISAQGVLCFFLDTFPAIHHILRTCLLSWGLQSPRALKSVGFMCT